MKYIFYDSACDGQGITSSATPICVSSAKPTQTSHLFELAKMNLKDKWVDAINHKWFRIVYNLFSSMNDSISIIIQ